MKKDFLKVKYASSTYNVLEVKDIAGVTFYGIEDEIMLMQRIAK